MRPTLALAPILLLVLVGVVLVVLLARGRAGLWMARGRRPRKRHIVTRIICAALGVFILAAVAVGTWQEVRRSYEHDEHVEALAVHVPTRPTPPLPELGESGARRDIESARLLVHLAVVDVSSGRFRPLHVEENEIKWPEDGRREHVTSFEVGGIKVEQTLSINKLHTREVNSDGPPVLGWMGDAKIAWSGPALRGQSFSVGGSLQTGVTACAPMDSARALSHSPLSIMAGPLPPELRTFLVITPVAEDDPLEEAAALEFVRNHEGAMREVMSKPGSGAPTHRSRRLRVSIPMPGVALAVHIGISSLLFLVAAILLTQLFVRRSLAFAGVLAAVVLYVAALDRAVLGAHLSRLRDPSASVATRLTAATQATYTFFYQETARAALDEVREAEAAPGPLREAAHKGVVVLPDSPPFSLLQRTGGADADGVIANM